MSTITPDIINRLNLIQNQIWQTVSVTVSEAAEQQITFQSPLTVASKTADLYAEFSAPMMCVQFAFANLPENPQAILIPQDTSEGLATLLTNEEVTDIDENTVASIRSILEGIVQGICLAVGSVKNETVVATGMTIRFQNFSFPPNLQKCEELGRVQVAIAAGDGSGTATWIMDQETVHNILNIPMEEEVETPFPEISADSATGMKSSGDDNGLDMLMDIPLEISVELGRVRMMVREVVELGTGSIVELDKLAGEPVDVMVNGRPVARGEVVVIEDNFGVRITEVLNPADRIARLGEAA